MRKHHSTRLSIVLLSVWFCGCVSDISRDWRYPTDYIVGGVYRLKQPVFAEKADLTIFGTYADLILHSVGQQSGGLPASVEEFGKYRSHWKHIAGVAKPGTLITVSKIQLEKNPENGKMMSIRGRLLDVPWAKKMAELAFISKRAPYRGLAGYLLVVDTNILQLLTRP